jgi:hypothetical protein
LRQGKDAGASASKLAPLDRSFTTKFHTLRDQLHAHIARKRISARKNVPCRNITDYRAAHNILFLSADSPTRFFTLALILYWDLPSQSIPDFSFGHMGPMLGPEHKRVHAALELVALITASHLLSAPPRFRNEVVFRLAVREWQVGGEILDGQNKRYIAPKATFSRKFKHSL